MQTVIKAFALPVDNFKMNVAYWTQTTPGRRKSSGGGAVVANCKSENTGAGSPSDGVQWAKARH